MADLLATLDEIAEDLRSELDTADDALEVAQTSEVELSLPREERTSIEPTEIAVRAYLRRRVGDLTQPLDLATLAWETQRQFGQDISQGWLGHGTFKALLLEAVPGIEVSGAPPSYVIPAGYRFDASVRSFAPPSREGEVPTVIEFLKSIDRSFPIWSTEAWQDVFELTSAATTAFLSNTVFDLRSLNELTRVARDRSQASSNTLPRATFDYVAKGLWYSHRLSANMSPDEVGECFYTAILNRVGEAISVTDESKQELRSWLGLAER